MSFCVAQKTLERLEWPRVVELLRNHCSTPEARQTLSRWAEHAAPEGEASSPFAANLQAARIRLDETSEARSLLEAQIAPSRGGVHDIADALAHAEKGGVLAPKQLRDLGSTLAAVHESASALLKQRGRAPRLAERATLIAMHRELEQAIDDAIDRGGEVRDEASPALQEARGAARSLGSELKNRLEGYLQNDGIRAALSDLYFTIRNDRYVLPVRSDARSRVRGIIHDASNSGTTLFVEPEAVVELNNRLKQAELDAAREVERVLRDLSAQVTTALPSLRASLSAFAGIDIAFARGLLSIDMKAARPVVENDGVFILPQLRHPLIAPVEAVPNDLHLGETHSVLVISGANAGGKTVAMKSLALAALFARAGLHVTASGRDQEPRVALVDSILADIGDEQDIRQSLSTFSGHMLNLAEVVRAASPYALIVLDEIGTGTDPAEGACLAQAILESLADSGARVVVTTHYNLLKEMASIDERFANASVGFDPITLAPTYQLQLGTPGFSSAATVAARMGMPSAVLERAAGLLDSEDRQLDQMLAELAVARSALDSEQRNAEKMRSESRAVRDEYRAKLERLQARRDQLFRTMRNDLDHAFKDAHSQIASVITDLQRGASAQQAARAREALQQVDQQARDVEEKLGLNQIAPATEPRLLPIDWRRAAAGDPVRIASGVIAVLQSLPDRRGRVTVLAGSARLVLPAEQVGVAAGTSTPGRRERAGPIASGQAPHPEPAGGTVHCDLRGLRVAEALEQLEEIIDRAAAEGRDALRIVHGLGTGALRAAVREQLAASPLVATVRGVEQNEGGAGVTEALFRRAP